MNDFELLRVIEYLERTRRPYRALFPMADEDPVWNILVHLVKSHLRGDVVTISTLAEAANVPYATAHRRIKSMISDQRIVRKARGPKTFSLHPSEATLADFLSYAQHIKSLLAQVMGVRPAEEEADDYYFGGSRLEAQLWPPPNLLRRQGEAERLRFLLHADNYFASLQNLWSDFRANRGSRRDFDLRALPDLYRRAAENAVQPVSDYDVIVLNVPWLGEFVETGHSSRGTLPLRQRHRQLGFRSEGLGDRALEGAAGGGAGVLVDRVARRAKRPDRRSGPRLPQDLL